MSRYPPVNNEIKPRVNIIKLISPPDLTVTVLAPETADIPEVFETEVEFASALVPEVATLPPVEVVAPVVPPDDEFVDADELLVVEATIPDELDPGIGSGIAVDAPLFEGFVIVVPPVLVATFPDEGPLVVVDPVDGVGLLRAGPFGFRFAAVRDVPAAGIVAVDDPVVELALMDGAEASKVLFATVVDPPTVGTVPEVELDEVEVVLPELDWAVSSITDPSKTLDKF